MRFRAFVILLLFSVLVGACSRNSAPGTPISPETLPGPSILNASRTVHSGHNLLGYWQIHVDPAVPSMEAVPVRISEFHANVLQFMEYGPCTDCLRITGVTALPGGDIEAEFTFIHPFSQPNLTGFDVRGIAMFQGSLEFPEFGLLASSCIEGDAQIVNPDGHTTLYHPGTSGNGIHGYVKGRLAPHISTPDATINAFKNYYTDADRRYFRAGNSVSVSYVIRPRPGGFTFGYAVDACWEKPEKPVVVPDSFPISANCPEPYRIEASVDHDLPSGAGSSATLTIDVYDWQGADTVGSVQVEAPYFFSGLVDADEVPGGPGSKRFTCELVNEYGSAAADQSFPILIRVLDDESEPGALIDNIAWRIVHIPVTSDNPPLCAAEISNADPEEGEMVTFTDTSTDPDGPGDLDESWWDWDNDGTWDEEGFEVTRSWNETGIYYVNHMVRDQSGLTDTLSDPIIVDVGMIISLEEDLAAKDIGISYHYMSVDQSYSSGAYINVDDLDGPWDFNVIGLEMGPSWTRILDVEDEEVQSFRYNFNSDTTHFVKYESLFDPFFETLYQAEQHNFDWGELTIYGFHDPDIIGSSPFGPPDTEEYLSIPYPLTIDTDYAFEIRKPGFILDYKVEAIGRGDVTVPYGGGSTINCLLIRYIFTVYAAEPVNGGTLNFVFVADDGRVIANVVAVNDPPIYNWNASTNKIYAGGMTLFQALHQIV